MVSNDEKLLLRPVRRVSCWLVAGVFSLSVLAVASPGIAAGTKENLIYDCDVKIRGRGWVPTRILFQFIENGSKVTVNDPRINTLNGGPMTVAVKVRKNGNKRFRWVLTTPSSEHAIAVSYTLDFDEKLLSGTVRANVQGNSGGRHSGLLTCKTRKGKIR